MSTPGAFAVKIPTVQAVQPLRSVSTVFEPWQLFAP